MVPEQFIASVESNFGQYKDGMRASVKDHIRHAQPGEILRLYRGIIESHDGRTPPNLAQIRRIATKDMVSLAGSSASYESECVHCQTRFPLEMYDCPHCGIGNPDMNRDEFKPLARRKVVKAGG